jgi:hypothetical protein
MPEITNHGKLFFREKALANGGLQRSFSALRGNNAHYAA